MAIVLHNHVLSLFLTIKYSFFHLMISLFFLFALTTLSNITVKFLSKSAISTVSTVQYMFLRLPLMIINPNMFTSHLRISSLNMLNKLLFYCTFYVCVLTEIILMQAV